MGNYAIFEIPPSLLVSANPAAAWDLVSFFNNASSYVKVAGGALISLMGLVVVVWAAVLIAKKFFGNSQQQQESWFKIVLMIIIGGALMTGGITLITGIARGGQTTIEELGGGFILIQNALALVG